MKNKGYASTVASNGAMEVVRGLDHLEGLGKASQCWSSGKVEQDNIGVSFRPHRYSIT